MDDDNNKSGKPKGPRGPRPAGARTGKPADGGKPRGKSFGGKPGGKSFGGKSAAPDGKRPFARDAASVGQDGAKPFRKGPRPERAGGDDRRSLEGRAAFSKDRSFSGEKRPYREKGASAGDRPPRPAWKKDGDRKPAPHRQMPGWAGQMGAGGAIGLVSGLVGAGGAFMSVPFMLWCNVPLRHAVGTSAALGFPIALSATAGYVIGGWSLPSTLPGAVGYLYLPALFTIAAASVVMAPLGARTAHRIDVQSLRRLFALLLMALAATMLWRVFG